MVICRLTHHCSQCPSPPFPPTHHTHPVSSQPQLVPRKLESLPLSSLLCRVIDHSQIIHEGGHVGSRNQKRRWVLHWRGVILTDLGHGRSRDRLRSILSLNCGTTFHRFLINHWVFFSVFFFSSFSLLLLLSPEETVYARLLILLL